MPALKHKSSVLDFKALHSWVCGFLLSMPYSYPTVPYYWFAGAVYLSMLFYATQPISRYRVLLVVCAVILAMLSNLIGLRDNSIGTAQVAFSAIYFSLFLFGDLVPKPFQLLKGFLTGIFILSCAVLALAIQNKLWHHGPLLFIIPSLRLWGHGYFPDWPNFFAFMLSFGALLAALVYRKYATFLICIVASLLTTSRTTLLAIVLVCVYFIMFRGWRITLLWSIIAGVFLATFLQFVLGTPELQARLFVTSDRVQIYSAALNLFKEAPILGQGSVLLEHNMGNVGAPSYHNTYLDILVRHGALGFILFSLLLLPDLRGISARNMVKIAVLISFFLLGSLFQNFLKHPHIVMLYSVVVSQRIWADRRKVCKSE